MLLKDTFIPFCLIFISSCGQHCIQKENEKTSLKPNFDSIRITLEKIYDEDQRVREILMDSIGFNSPGAQVYISTVMRKVDGENRSILLSIIDKYGWIPRSKIGQKASEGIFIVVQHAETDLMDRYFPQLDSLAQIGEASKTDAAMMEDRLLLRKGLKQKYGTQAGRLRQDKKALIWPIAEPNKVDSLRKAIGFELTVSESAQRLGAIYDPDLKLPKDTR